MYIIAVGLNYKTAPVEIRERLSFNEADLSAATTALKNKKSILENVIVSTCNRTEVYAVVDQLHTGRYYIKDFLSEWFQIDKEEFTPYLFFYEQDGAIEHLFKVICGLNSMVLGETQILGQVKNSFFMSQEVSATGTIFNHLFKEAITLAKKAHSETEIGSNAVSVSYAAVELAKKVLGDLKNKHVLVVGAGKMGKLAIENLYGSGATKVSVINRTFEKAQDLAQQFNGQAKTLQELQCAIVEADILISSTGSKDYVITKDMMLAIERMRKGRPLFMVDIAVPRDLDPSIADLDSVFLYDIDDLEGIVEANLAERKKAAENIMLMIEEEIVRFNEWVNMLGVVPVITTLREKALSIQKETMMSIERKMPNLTERERKILNKHTKSIVNQLLKDPVAQAKEIAAQPNAAEQLELFKKIFNIDEQPEQMEEKSQSTSLKWNVQPV
ncbi:glutamyl-tRNA reductase [Heyndrickxia oleronia]|jgi:glutamyl-tRNA reductase|uniref:Glutamyl-tRNA reductase n=1 Tax=Heyndrickxia oleronia TaxID=38875 RepID=A0A8E2IEK6_9BACI|nr:glutamyl-tRNA reductase [Heyndrickxia oleronia]NYV64418.1 glutamyl-tRNA reductase [Bacillus sp. Gen3]OJH17491.1 glutamyl-tRNA reductase [Bacillus obstructivus]MCM3455396.1 glutamyl-tRNA reductase [Heyndrickxia oleronia]MEC1374674.1 glutamyl-tRNA reductase [Heyndrickxia oleronia]OOP68461.1 glutamyl-tRNA reductase [Heyndrickxia oleronia]